ncbi:MAG: hypothetical protein NXI04_24725 [Planctomycetaceae bacterium]|nr:hypothetical protein [Planctomycetaceae bacterium]
MPHQIRLAGPWEFSVGAHDTAIRCQLPYALPRGVTAGEMIRRFHRPSGLSASTRLALIVVTPVALSEVMLNRSKLIVDQTASEGVDWDGTVAVRNVVPCTNKLTAFNELTVLLSSEGCTQVLAASLAIHETDEAGEP